MIKQLNRKTLMVSAAFVVGMTSASSAQAANNFGNIVDNIATSINGVPGFITSMGYLIGILFGVLGVLKIKDHVENPGNTPLKEGAIRLLAGGALLAMPIIYESMQDLPGSGAALTVRKLEGVSGFTGVN